jgi:hypothetical protein
VAPADAVSPAIDLRGDCSAVAGAVLRARFEDLPASPLRGASADLERLPVPARRAKVISLIEPVTHIEDSVEINGETSPGLPSYIFAMQYKS